MGRMSLAARLREVGEGTYTWKLHGEPARQQAPYLAIQDLARELQSLVPAHYEVHWSQGVGGLPVGLWAAILDPDVTQTPTKGLYVVFLYSQDRRSLSLSLNQGVTAAKARAKETGQRPRDLLRAEAVAIRSALDSLPADLETEIELGPGGLLPDYEAGNIVAKSWAVESIPDDLQSDLDRLLGLYSSAVMAREDALVRTSDPAALPPRDPARPRRPVTPEFKPKDASSYKAHIKEQDLRKNRTHERIVDRVGKYLLGRGFAPNTNVHPIDLEATRPDHDPIMIEVKYFPAGHPRESVRQAIGQLYEYRHFYGTPDQPLAVVLSEHPGGAYVDLLTDLGLAVMWPDGHSWAGNQQADLLALTGG